MTQCPYCDGDGSYDKQIKRVDYFVLRTWLSGPAREKFPIHGSLDKLDEFCDSLVNLVWKSKKTVVALFDRARNSTIAKHHVHCFFLQLLALLHTILTPPILIPLWTLKVGVVHW